jgi:hypothetical protein
MQLIKIKNTWCIISESPYNYGLIRYEFKKKKSAQEYFKILKGRDRKCKRKSKWYRKKIKLWRQLKEKDMISYHSDYKITGEYLEKGD